MSITILDITFASFIIILGLIWYKVIRVKNEMGKQKTTITEPWRFYL